MSVEFSFGATTCTFSRSPDVGDYDVRRKYMNPRIRSSGGTPFVYGKDLSNDFHKLSWKRMPVADYTNLMAFLAAVDGSANPFDYTDVSGTKKPAFILNANELRSAPVWHMTEEVSIELMLAPSNILLDETGVILSDEVYTALYDDSTILPNVCLDETGVILTDESDYALLDQTETNGLLDEGGDYCMDENYTVITEE